jgi:sugar phosphate isomerase/epimerase
VLCGYRRLIQSRRLVRSPSRQSLGSVFDAAVENARTIIDAVKPARAKFCYEMMGWSLPDSPASFLRMLKAIDRPGFGVHLDPCNLVNTPARFYRSTDLLNECFDLLGPSIVSCHAKDLTWDVEMNIHFREVRPGAGSMDYDTYLRRLAALPQRPPLMLEHLPNADEYDKAGSTSSTLAGASPSMSTELAPLVTRGVGSRFAPLSF